MIRQDIYVFLCICIMNGIVTFFWTESELVVHHVNGDEGEQNRGERDEKTQVFGNWLLNVGNPQKNNSWVQVDQPVKPVDYK